MERVGTEAFDDQVLHARLPALVVFTASWCGPCKWLHPYLEAVASRTTGRLLIFEVDVDSSPGLAERYTVGSIPTVVWVRGGEEIDRSVGVEPQRLLAWAARLERPAREGHGGPGKGA